MDNKALVDEFVSVTGATEEEARKLLAAHNNSIEHAVSAFFNAQAETVDVGPIVVKEPPAAVARGAEGDDWTLVEQGPPLTGGGQIPEEAERNVALLIAKHRGRLDALRAATADVLRAEHDDLFLLRYCLSFDDKAAAEAIRWSVAWRAEAKNAYWMERAEQKEASLMKMNSGDGGADKKVTGINISAYHAGLLDGGPLQIVRPGLVDFGPMLDMHDHDRMVMFHVMQKEVAYRMCDRRTRETGRLVKLVVINDFTAMRMSMPPKKVMQSYSDSSKLAERLYPQMLQTTVCINVPTWFSMVMKVGKLFMSAKTLDKFKVCPKNGRIEDCPFVRKYLRAEQLPSFVGGKCGCEHQHGCIPGLANETKVCRTLTKAEIEKLHADQQKESAEEKQKMAAFIEAYKLRSAASPPV